MTTSEASSAIYNPFIKNAVYEKSGTTFPSYTCANAGAHNESLLVTIPDPISSLAVPMKSSGAADGVAYTSLHSDPNMKTKKLRDEKTPNRDPAIGNSIGKMHQSASPW